LKVRVLFQLGFHFFVFGVDNNWFGLGLFFGALGLATLGLALVCIFGFMAINKWLHLPFSAPSGKQWLLAHVPLLRKRAVGKKVS
jgi:hypothetical protein